MTTKILAGDCRTVLPTLAANSVHCVVTSPPYYGLRDYGTAQWDGGDAGCDHTGIRRGHGDEKQATSAGTSRDPVSRTCLHCGARRIDRQIGLEATPDEYLQTMVEVFREVRRVLRDDGTCWVNMGDSYAHGVPSGTAGTQYLAGGAGKPWRGFAAFSTVGNGYKPKDLLMMPARLALALQADGWWLRSQIVWAKPNPMPESVTDRPTSAYEMVYLLSKKPRYFYDADAVRENVGEETRRNVGFRDRQYMNGRAANGIDDGYTAMPRDEPSRAGRSLRNVWTIATQAFPEAHFATFPAELAERCIRAGTSERGCCAQCGKPWWRITDKTFVPQPDVSLQRGMRLETQHDAANQWPGTPRGSTSTTTTGWQPGCTHGADVVPATVLDPFAGAGTTLLVADRLQRNAIGIELNAAYTEMAMERCRRDAPLFADLAPVPSEDAYDRDMRDLFAAAAD